MKISKNLLKAIAASVILGGVVTSCASEKVSIKPAVACEADCQIDHKHIKHKKKERSHIDNCPACGMG